MPDPNSRAECPLMPARSWCSLWRAAAPCVVCTLCNVYASRAVRHLPSLRPCVCVTGAEFRAGLGPAAAPLRQPGDAGRPVGSEHRPAAATATAAPAVPAATPVSAAAAGSASGPAAVSSVPEVKPKRSWTTPPPESAEKAAGADDEGGWCGGGRCGCGCGFGMCIVWGGKEV